MNSILKRIKSVDLVVILFCLFTGIYILLGLKNLDHVGSHIFIRILFIAIILMLLKVDDSQNKFLIFIRNFYPLLFLGFFYSETDYYNNLLFTNLDFHLVRLESLLLGAQLSLEFSELVPYRWFSELMHFGYFSYYILIFGIPLLFYIKAKCLFEKTMFITILSFCFYYLFFILFPSIGPQFYFPADQITVPKGYFFQETMDIIISIGETQTGAFPSSHVGIATILLILTYKNFKRLSAYLIPFILILVLSTVYIKAHYVIDVIAGFISGFLFYYLSNRIYNKYIIRTSTPEIL